MAEGYSFNPNSHEDAESDSDSVELQGGGSILHRILRSRQSARQEEYYRRHTEPAPSDAFLHALHGNEKDDDDEKKNKRTLFWRARRIARALSPFTVDRTPVDGEKPDKRPSMFGIETDYQTPTQPEGPEAALTATADKSMPIYDTSSPEKSPTEHTVVAATTEQSRDDEKRSLTDENASTKTPENVGTAAKSASEATVFAVKSEDLRYETGDETVPLLPEARLREPTPINQTRTEPERVSNVVDRWNRGREVYIREQPRDVFDYTAPDKSQEKLAKKVVDLEQSAKVLQTHLETRPLVAPVPQASEIYRASEASKPKTVEAIESKAEALNRAAERVAKKLPIVNPEKATAGGSEQSTELRSEKAVENELESKQSPEAQKWESAIEHERMAQREKLLVTAQEAAANPEVDETKELAYEMSHEHKDLDKQTASAWAVLQAKADATARANAQAVARAQQDHEDAKQHEAAADKMQQNAAYAKKSVYKTAVISGVTTAVVVIAVLLLIILIQSK